MVNCKQWFVNTSILSVYSVAVTVLQRALCMHKHVHFPKQATVHIYIPNDSSHCIIIKEWHRSVGKSIPEWRLYSGNICPWLLKYLFVKLSMIQFCSPLCVHSHLIWTQHRFEIDNLRRGWGVGEDGVACGWRSDGPVTVFKKQSSLKIYQNEHCWQTSVAVLDTIVEHIFCLFNNK